MRLPLNAWGNPISKGADPLYTQNPFRYRGYYYDEETGFYFLQTRYYDPEVKRFINADSLFVAGNELTGANMYAYCNGNPVMCCDPSGMMSIEESNKLLALSLFFIFALVPGIAMLLVRTGFSEDGALSMIEMIFEQYEIGSYTFMEVFDDLLQWAADMLKFIDEKMVIPIDWDSAFASGVSNGTIMAVLSIVPSIATLGPFAPVGVLGAFISGFILNGAGDVLGQLLKR